MTKEDPLKVLKGLELNSGTMFSLAVCTLAKNAEEERDDSLSFSLTTAIFFSMMHKMMMEYYRSDLTISQFHDKVYESTVDFLSKATHITNELQQRIKE